MFYIETVHLAKENNCHFSLIRLTHLKLGGSLRDTETISKTFSVLISVEMVIIVIMKCCFSGVSSESLA